MSINAISSLSIYEYYYRIDKDEDKEKKSPLADEMKKYGLTPTENEALNVSLLKRAKELEKQNSQTQENSTIAKEDRPWADLMYQLNISFNDDPKEDINDIKEELEKLTRGLNDDELTKEINDLEDYVENLYVNFVENQSGSINTSLSLGSQLNNIAILNQANLL